MVRCIRGYSTDYYTVKSLAMGSLHRLRIRHDNGGSVPGWFVETVVVQDLKTYKKYRFICGEWLAKDQGDGNIERELYVEGIHHTNIQSQNYGNHNKYLKVGLFDSFFSAITAI